MLTPPCCPLLLREMMYWNVNQQILAPIDKTWLEVSGKSLFPKSPYDIPGMSVVSGLIANTCLGIWEHVFVRLFPIFEGQLSHYVKCQEIYSRPYLFLYTQTVVAEVGVSSLQKALWSLNFFFLCVSNASANEW